MCRANDPGALLEPGVHRTTAWTTPVSYTHLLLSILHSDINKLLGYGVLEIYLAVQALSFVYFYKHLKAEEPFKITDILIL